MSVLDELATETQTGEKQTDVVRVAHEAVRREGVSFEERESSGEHVGAHPVHLGYFDKPVSEVGPEDEMGVPWVEGVRHAAILGDNVPLGWRNLRENVQSALSHFLCQCG